MAAVGEGTAFGGQVGEDIQKEEASHPPEWGWKKTTPPSGPLLAVSALLHCIFGSNYSTLFLGNDNVVDLL